MQRTASTTGDSSRHVSLGGAVGQVLVDDVQGPMSMSSGSTASGKISTVTGTSTHTISSEIRRDQRMMSTNGPCIVSDMSPKLTFFRS